MYAQNGIMSTEEKEGEKGEEPVKPLFWIASTKDDLRAFPEKVKDVMGFVLFLAQKGGKDSAAWKVLDAYEPVGDATGRLELQPLSGV